ncbi:MAG: T9SS type A sorting domain-containing protein [Bacteroidales bacterium]|nr:T9SS type A sorting domain-containing protein [Bacteroidales bacterium]MCF8456915.1 T9SS type A sorting domain-containing protein [Bacteroidales bacterium]
MRKFILLFALLAMLTSSYGQQAAQAIKKNCEVSAVERFTPAEWQDYKTTKAYGDVFWAEQFAGAMPTGWVTVDNNSLGNVFIWTNATNPGLNGFYSTNTLPFASTSAANGYIDLPGDSYNTPVPSVMQDMDAYIQSPAINCDTAHSVMLKFEHYFRWCCTTPTMEVSVSNNNVDWTSWDVLNNVAANVSSANPEIFTVNITSIAALQSTVYIRFSLSGVSHYYWAIDDVQLMTGPENDVKFADERNYWFDSNWGAVGSFSRIPASQIMENVSGGYILNYGDAIQHNVNYEATILDESNTVVFNETSDTLQLSPYDTATLYIANTYVPTVSQTYKVAAKCYADEVDQVPDNNYVDTISWEITDNKIFSRDHHYERWNGGTMSPDGFGGGLSGDFIGVNYYLPNTATVNSISYYVDYRTTPGTVLKGQIYQGEFSTTQTEWIGTEEYTIEPKDIGTWVTIPKYVINPGSEVLTGQNNYIVGAEFYYNTGEDLLLGDEGEDYPHLLWLESVVRLTTDWFWVSNSMAYIRLNLEGAILPPVFESARKDSCGIDQTYCYIVSLSDPQNLPLTVTAESSDPDIDYTLTDLGGGMYLVETTVTPSSVNYVLNERFRIRIKADNGTVVNEQYFWIYVVPTAAPCNVGIEESSIDDVKIYPNPAQDLLYIDNTGNSSIYIYNLVGELVKSIDKADYFTTINIEGLAAGSYIISVVKNNEVVTKKFSKL